MSSSSRGGRGWLSTTGPAPLPLSKFISPAQLRKLRRAVQVAAVCYRIGDNGVEFLLVRTRGGRWTFPKGSAEPGLTHAQSAALEAYEEAGVHGRIEETAFARYVRRGPRTTGPCAEEFAIHAHLCEVTRLSTPQESRRHPTWFSAEKAKRRLMADRAVQDAEEFARVIERAVSRITRLRTQTNADPLQRVQFEVSGTPAGLQTGRLSAACVTRYVRRLSGDPQHSAGVEFAVNAQVAKILRFSTSAQTKRSPLLLGDGKSVKSSALNKKSRRLQIEP